MPGTILEIDAATKSQSITEYWSLNEVIEQGINQPFLGSLDEAVTKLEEILKTSVKQQMMSDVPLGVFLSGGVDSSTIAALMQTENNISVDTFTIGFEAKVYNEAEHAKKVAKHLATNHVELYVSEEDACNVIPKLSQIYDEPFSDSSQIPTYLVSELAKQYVTVCLSGDGGDELFCGYKRYHITAMLWSKISKIPYPLRAGLSFLIRQMPVGLWTLINNALPKKFKQKNIKNKISKMADMMKSRSLLAIYKNIISTWDDPESILINSVEPGSAITDPSRLLKLENAFEQMMAVDTISYLPDDILVKVDRASMSVGLETRVPLLSHKVIEFAWSLPLEYKLHLNQQKWCLKEVLFKHVPRQLLDRPKMGFGVPLDEWLRGPLESWVDQMLDPDRMESEGFFKTNEIIAMWNAHKSGDENWHHQLWPIIMFQAWYKESVIGQ